MKQHAATRAYRARLKAKGLTTKGTPPHVGLQEKLLGIIAGASVPVRPRDLESGYSAGSIRNALVALVKAGKIVRTAKGYRPNY